MAMNDAVIIRLYDEQPFTSDKLGGTKEIAIMCLAYKLETGQSLTEGEMLTALIRLRKAGSLAPKGDRHRLEPKKPTWPKMSEDRFFHVTIPVRLETVELYGLVSEFETKKKMMPATRQELYEFFQEYGERIFGTLTTWEKDDPEHRRRVIARTRQLFPEFY